MYLIGTFIEVIVVVIGFLNKKKFKNTIYTTFIFYLLYTALNEILGLFLGLYTKLPNDFLYNIYDIVTILFYLYLYKTLIISPKTIKLINYFMMAFIGSYIVEFLFGYFNPLTENSSYSAHIGSIFLLITLILFLFEIINNEKIVFNLHKSMIFWISIGLLLYVVGTIPIFISREIMNYNITYQYILFGLNVIMYGCFVAGFILSKKEYNYTDNGKY